MPAIHDKNPEPPTPDKHTPRTPEADAVQAVVRLLTSQLEAVLKTFDTLIQHPALAHFDITPTRHVLRQLSEKLESRAPQRAETPSINPTTTPEPSNGRDK